VINIGICGGEAKIGHAVLINRIVDMDTDREFFPDIIVKHPFIEGTLKTFSKPVTQDLSGFCDMEGSGFFQAASKFLSPDRIQLIKVVSDNFDGSVLHKDFVANLIGKHLDDLHNFITHMKKAYERIELIDSRDIKLIEDISQNLNLTESQKSLLKRIYVGSKLRNGHIPDSIEQFLNVRVEIKNESKREFTRLMDVLSK
jgi:hypothetical protein